MMSSVFLLITALAVVVQVVTSAGLTTDEKAVTFLHKYGYLSNRARSGNHDIKKAIRMFQTFMHLPVTGKLDQQTIKEMEKPRCGVADIEDFPTRVRRYVLWGYRWYRTDLTYFIQFGKDLYEEDQVRIFKEAFERWSKAAPKLKFTRTMDPQNADFRLSFGYSEHTGVPGERKCSSNFDGWNGVLAHAFAPRDGRVHFDEKEWWSAYENHGLFKQPLPQVATHEIGHALGLRHTDVKGAVMWPSCCYSTADLAQDDIDGIRKIYGQSRDLITGN